MYISPSYTEPPPIPPPRYSPFTFCRKCGCPREIPGSVCAYHTSEDLRRSSQIHASNGSSAVLWKLKKIRSFGVDLNNLYSSTPVQKKPNTWQVCWYIITEVNFTGYHGNVISCTDDDDISHGHTRLLKKKKSSRKLDEYDVKWDTAQGYSQVYSGGKPPCSLLSNRFYLDVVMWGNELGRVCMWFTADGAGERSSYRHTNSHQQAKAASCS